MSGFSDRPFVAGSVTGIRSFNVDRFARLKATQLEVVWMPGENTARCLKDLGYATGGLLPTSFSQIMQSYLPTSFTFYKDPPITLSADPVTMTLSATSTPPPVNLTKKPKPKPKPQHRLAGVDCTCGFYAYFDNGPNQYANRSRINGLIEGYGAVTVGSRGFRAEKARILALIIKPKRVTDETNRVRANYPLVPVFESKAAALGAFPLTPPAVPTPETDPEFWTREAL